MINLETSTTQMGRVDPITQPDWLDPTTHPSWTDWVAR